MPGVSILKPLVNSADPSLFQNLETFFLLDYPKYEIIFCVQETDDSRLRMYVDSLVHKYPSVQSKVSERPEQTSQQYPPCHVHLVVSLIKSFSTYLFTERAR